ncbi:RNA polymerase sigma factor (sigma-70 family) [Catalinimonas alkaloidigena]|uniref:RNA polymerase sigma factor n=1 Tax=Catalinimonas alkaloidigena TaxID=1075417 RepID=UPI00240682E0|nr:sigma-70 family RNA polymerase sigma factor [Catalinimonas alkaloidigena]MDF9799902.1 RNA polymerase sigma factor (sigma-70 family) [Catalinimonas alkaloidigena]
MSEQRNTYLKPIHQTDLLWEAFCKGSKQAYFQIYQEYVDELYNYGYKIHADRELVKDCLHDLFVNLWEKRIHLAKVQSIQFYLYASLRRKMLRTLKKRNLESFCDESMFELFSTGSHESVLIFQQERSQKSSLLKSAIKQLSARQREVVFLKYYDNFSYEEISGIMGISVESLYKLMTKALKSLKLLLHEKAVHSFVLLIHLINPLII